jgi:hypothetical protein
MEHLFLERLFPFLAAYPNGSKKFCPLFCGSGAAAPQATQSVSGEVGRESGRVLKNGVVH